ncbi:MAG: MATE family efflux transporter [Pseudomonadota bacterium]
MTSLERTAQNAPARRPFWADVARTWALAWPVFLVDLVVISISTIDVIMVGRASTDELAYLGIGRTVTWMAIVICSGLLSGVTVFAARADGAENPKEAGDILRRGIAYTAVLGVLCCLALFLCAEALLGALDLPTALVEQGADYVRITAVGLPFQLFTMCCFLWLEGISRPRPGMIVMFMTLPLNAGMNWVFIEGNLGAPALGASGAALATTLAQMIGAVLIVLYLRGMRDRDHWGVSLELGINWRSAWQDGKSLRRFGLMPGFATGMEFLGFNALNIMTGYLGIVVVGAYQVVFSLHAISFSVAMGFASATAVRVGNAMGRNDPAAVGHQVRLSAGMTAAAMLPFVLVYLFIPDVPIAVFGVDADVAALAMLFVAIIAPFLIFDGLQYMLVFALRAAGDEVVASVLQVGSFLVVMAGASAVLTFVLDYGPAGIGWGMVAGIVCAATLLGSRFLVVQRKLMTQSAPHSPSPQAQQ